MDPTRTPIVEPLSHLERRFESVRAKIGLAAAPLLFLWVLWRPLTGLTTEAHRLAAVMSAVIMLWVTEALPMPMTALLGAAACVALGVAPAREVFAPFADQLMFLFIGSFILARAIFLNGLDRRFAFGVLSLKWVGPRPGRILFAFGAVTAFISAWISNTATTAMMFAIGMSIIGFLVENEQHGGSPFNRQYATGLMLMTSFAASIGGLATPVGTPPNLIGLGYIREQLHVEYSFFSWSLIGVPVVLCLFAILFSYLYWLCPAGVRRIEGSDEMLARQKASLGPWTTAQRSTLAAFGVTVVLWLTPGIIGFAAGEDSPAYQAVSRRMPEAFAALVGAGLLFLLPGQQGRKAITWDEAAHIDWGVVLLYGGGFAFGILANKTGLAEAAGQALIAWLPMRGGFGLVVAATIVATVVSEATSNTASANIVVPVVIALSQAAHVDPLEPALAATMASSLGFMLPVSTPCNAIVYGSGYVPLTRMIRYGLLLDLGGIVVIITLVRVLVPLVR